MLSGVRIILIVIIAVAGLISQVPFLGEQPASAHDGENLDISPTDVVKKANPKLDSQLNQLVSAESRKQTAGFAEQRKIELAEGGVRVIIECEPGQVASVSEVAARLGTSVEESWRDMLQAIVPINSLVALADTPAIRFVRCPYRPVASVVSEGVELINADNWHAAGYTGTGVKIAIVDGGFSGYTTRQDEGELPAVVTTWWAPSLTGPGTSPHGTACAEIVYDTAPGSNLYLVNFGTEVELGNAVDYLIAQGVDIISFSMGYTVAGPGDGTGVINEIVAEARDAGILWVPAMGNQAKKHWMGSFTDNDSDGWHDFNHNPVDERNTISASAEAAIWVDLKWDDGWDASANDYDLYLLDDSGEIVASSLNWQNGNDHPIESLDYTATYTGTYGIAIRATIVSQAKTFHLYSNRELEYQDASSSLIVPADSRNAMSVGAVPWNNPDTLESFSSRGPTEDGRIKPDLVAPDAVSSVTYGAFSGTSAAAPHVAAAAALVKEFYPGYSPTEVQDYLETNAIDLGVAGKDNLYGSGRLRFPEPITVPVISFMPSDNITITAGENVTFTAITSDGGPVTSWAWDFDNDGITDSTDNVTTYNYGNVAGTYTVKLTGSNAIGSDSETRTITVQPATPSKLGYNPAPATSVTAGATWTQFKVEIRDQYDNLTTSTDNVTVSPSAGAFTSGATNKAAVSGVATFDDLTYTNTGTITVTASSGSLTQSVCGSIQVVPGPLFTAKLQGGLRPTEGYDVPLTLKLYETGTTLNYLNVLTEIPDHTASTANGDITIIDTNTATKTIIFQVTGLSTGTYNIGLYSPHCLINLAEAVTVGETLLDMGMLLEGNANDDVQIAGADFSMLLNDYLETPDGDEWNNGRCDFDRNEQVTSVDFSAIAQNYNLTSPRIVE